jgi:hypothetical protein
MTDPFIKKLNEYHLCTWYILPLLGLNVKSFGYDAFITRPVFVNSFIVMNREECIAVEVTDMYMCPKEILQHHACVNVVHATNSYIIYQLPVEWKQDFRKFILGKYSKFSDEAKQMIREFSGLKYEVVDAAGNYLTDAILMALDRHHVLKQKWMEIIGTTEQYVPEELLSIPSLSSFITL